MRSEKNVEEGKDYWKFVGEEDGGEVTEKVR